MIHWTASHKLPCLPVLAQYSPAPHTRPHCSGPHGLSSSPSVASSSSPSAVSPDLSSSQGGEILVSEVKMLHLQLLSHSGAWAEARSLKFFNFDTVMNYMILSILCIHQYRC